MACAHLERRMADKQAVFFNTSNVVFVRTAALQEPRVSGIKVNGSLSQRGGGRLLSSGTAILYEGRKKAKPSLRAYG
jgi:hypothetical protein